MQTIWKSTSPFCFDDFVKVDDRTMQLLMRELTCLDSEILATALKNARNEVKDVFFRNTSKRTASMFAEDMEKMAPFTESDMEKARQVILDIFEDLTKENT